MIYTLSHSGCCVRKIHTGSKWKLKIRLGKYWGCQDGESSGRQHGKWRGEVRFWIYFIDRANGTSLYNTEAEGGGLEEWCGKDKNEKSTSHWGSASSLEELGPNQLNLPEIAE